MDAAPTSQRRMRKPPMAASALMPVERKVGSVIADWLKGIGDRYCLMRLSVGQADRFPDLTEDRLFLLMRIPGNTGRGGTIVS